MKILIVGKIPTHPVCAGNQRLITDQAILLRKLKHDVHYLFVYEKGLKQGKQQGYEILASMREFWGDNMHLYEVSLMKKIYFNVVNLLRYNFFNAYYKCDDFYPNKLDKMINRLHENYNFDVCIVNYYYLSKALEKIRIPKKALLTHDSFIYRGMKAETKVYDTLTPNEEAKALQRAPYILSVQDDESILFRYLSPRSKIFTIYTVFDYIPRKIVGNKNILYLAGAGSFNKNGIVWFIENVFPSIIDKFSDVKLIVGGGICNLLTTYSDHNNINLLGYIDNINDFFSQGDVFINPTFQGSGLKIKTFEAIANDMVTITHPHSYEGIFNKDISPLYYSDRAVDWCRFLKEIWNDRNKIDEIKKKNKNYINEMNNFIINQYELFLND